jgi:ssDNA-binding Zn-finger/Zn-ribbon topoisomerase 1
MIEYIPKKCPDCGADLKYYHGNGGSRMVCNDKCKGYKVIASTTFKKRFYEKGDVI